MSSKRGHSSSKLAHCTVEGAGWPAVTVEIEHIGTNSRPSKKPKTPRDVNRRRKPVPKSIEFEAKSSLKSHDVQQALPNETLANLESQEAVIEEPLNVFNDWMRGLDDADQDIELDGKERADEPERSQRKVSKLTRNTRTTAKNTLFKLMETPNFYLREWQALFCDSYVQAMYDREGPPVGEQCNSCQIATDRLYSCNSCLAFRSLCSACLISLHRFQPTHRPKIWDGSCWTDTSLSDLGLVLNLGHFGAPCDLNDTTSKILVGDLDGFTDVQVRYCQHPGSSSRSLQLLSVGLFPCSDRRPETAFTLKLLDNYDVFNTVGRTSGHKIYSVLERVTKPGFPDDVSDRYRELLNTYRKYLHVIKLRRAGHLFQPHPHLDVHPGDQAFDCVACPRPGFNFDWKEVCEGERPWFCGFFSYDGNARSYRKSKKVDAGDVCFSDGDGYFPPKQLYEEWVKSHPEPKRSEQKPACDNHKAGKDLSVKFAGRDVTGIGTFTCTSHSCIAPRGMVDFFQGERQIYCDFAFAAMYKYLSARGYLPIGMTYDIWCHWWINFFRRMKNLPALYTLPANLDLLGAIPKWHLLGHNRVCWIRWSLDHMQYVGRMEGEGPERVWSHFNEHSGSTSEQGPGQRTDSLNNIVCDWNFSKATEMHRTLPARFRDAKKARNKALRDHEDLTASLPRKSITKWEKESIEPVDENGDGKQWKSPLMDPVLKGGFHETIQEERENESKALRTVGKRNGAVRWIVEGIELEHSIKNLRDEEKEHGLKPTPRQANTINSKRIAIRDRVEAFMEKRPLYMPDVDEPDCACILEFVGEDGEWTDAIDLGLPSSYLQSTLANAGLATFGELEKKLRRGMCKDSVESVKRLLGGKAAAIKYKSTQLSGQIAVTRAESTIRAHTTKIHKACWRYNNSRDALLRLGPTEDDLNIYKVLKHEDLKPLKTYFEDYAQNVGHGVSSMSWIWKSTVAPNKGDWEIEALKTEWFRSRERFKRWDEQLVLTKRKMVMTIRSFQSHQDIWEWKACNGQATPGMRAFACRRSRFFAELSHRMLAACHPYLKDDVVALSWADNWLAANVSGDDLIRPCRTTARYRLGLSPPPSSSSRQMRMEGPIRNDAALRALCEGLEVEIFGEGSYEEFMHSLACNFDGDEMDYVEDGVDTENGNNQRGDGCLGGDDISLKKRSGTLAVKTSPYKKKKAPSGLVISSQGASATIKSSPKPVQPKSRSHLPATASHDSLTGPGVSNRCQQGHGTSTAQQANDLATPPRTPLPSPSTSPPRTSPLSMFNPPEASDGKSPAFSLSCIPSGASSILYLSSSAVSSTSTLRDERSVDRSIYSLGRSSPV
ncbi:hypothetical protein FRC08_006096 [Ceratobasidium sp. 394]|nr:hypothetical protein FRC08_006096 [Ceratobasidium sp. 394]